MSHVVALPEPALAGSFNHYFILTTKTLYCTQVFLVIFFQIRKWISECQKLLLYAWYSSGIICQPLEKNAATRRENLASHFVLSWLLTGSRAPRLPCCFCLQSVQDLNQVNLLTSFVLVFCCFCFTCPHTWSLEKKGSEVERNRKFRYLFPNVGSKSKKTWKKNKYLYRNLQNLLSVPDSPLG